MQNKEKMLLIHGFGATGVTFYKMFKPLSTKYNLFCPDLLGMGLSSRPEDLITNNQDIIDFFINSIEEWRKSLGIEEPFHLVGHSLGGYIATLYALKYPHNIKKFSLMSPVGITKTREHIVNNMEWYRKLGARVSYPFWNMRLSYQRPYQLSGLIGYYTLKQIVKIKYPKLPREENNALGHYFSTILHLPRSTEYCVYYIFDPPVPCAKIPLEDSLIESDLKVNFFFGEKDWMDTSGVDNLCKADNSRFKKYMVSDSGHNMKLENAEEISNYLLI